MRDTSIAALVEADAALAYQYRACGAGKAEVVSLYESMRQKLTEYAAKVQDLVK